MTRVLALTLICFAAALTAAGCANPADDKPVATVNEPKPITDSPAPVAAVSTPAATPAVSPTAIPAGALAIATDTSKIDFEGSKVTGSHKGGFKSFNGFQMLKAKARQHLPAQSRSLIHHASRRTARRARGSPTFSSARASPSQYDSLSGSSSRPRQ